MNTLASRLTEAMTKANVTASELSRTAKVTHVTISYILSGRNADVRSQIAARLASALNCDLAWLITGKQSNSPTALAPSRRKGCLGITKFPGSVVFCREQNPPITHGHLYRVLTGERQSKSLVKKYAAWLKANGLQWPQAAKVKPAA
jgi:DNA-binding Xre family transcriptional regulator